VAAGELVIDSGIEACALKGSGGGPAGLPVTGAVGFGTAVGIGFEDADGFVAAIFAADTTAKASGSEAVTNAWPDVIAPFVGGGSSELWSSVNVIDSQLRGFIRSDWRCRRAREVGAAARSAHSAWPSIRT
jgi:hypothetical protein